MARRCTVSFLLGSLLFEGSVNEAGALQPVGSAAGDEMPTLEKGRPPLAKAARLLGRHRQPTDPSIRKGLPPTPGCYMRMISGCPSQPMKDTWAWRGDAWADQRGVDEAGCHGRKAVWDRYCRAEDAEMLYVGGSAGRAPELRAEAPQAPQAPTGSPRAFPQPGVSADSDIPMVASPRTYSDFPVAQAPQAPTGSPGVPAQSGVSADSYIPMVASPKTYSDVPVSEAPQAPTYPSTLPVHPRTGADSVVPVAASPGTYSVAPVAQADEDEEEEDESPPSLSIPMAASPKTYPDFPVAQPPQASTGSPGVPARSGGSADTYAPVAASPKTYSGVAEAPRTPTGPPPVPLRPRSGRDSDVLTGYPSKPGCYLRTPSGCPARPMKTRMWRHDVWAEAHHLSETGCRERKRVWDKYCEVGDVKVLFVPR